MPQREQRKPNGPFEAISFNNRTGRYLRTHHDTVEKARKRLAANTRHSLKKIVYHTAEAAEKAELAKLAEMWEQELLAAE